MAKSLHRSLEAKLAALEGPEWESSDEEEDVPAVVAPPVGGKKKKKAGRKNRGARDGRNAARRDGDEGEDEDGPSSVVYVGHVPRDFAEVELGSFLRQFGTVTRIRLSRSRRSGRPRGYAFVEFRSSEVASIVAETLSGYLLGGRRLVSHLLPRGRVHPMMFASPPGGPRSLAARARWRRDRNRKGANRSKTEGAMRKITERLVERERGRRRRFEALGIEYEFPGYEAAAARESGSEEAEAAGADARASEAEPPREDPELSEKKKKKRKKDAGAHAGGSTPAKKSSGSGRARTTAKEAGKKAAGPGRKSL